MPPARRLFFALWPDEDTRERLRRSTRAAVRQAHGRAVPVRNFHLTLAFLGNVAAERFDAIVATARQLQPPVLDLVLDRYGYFAAARVFWLGASRTPAELSALALSLWSGMEAAGLRRDSKPFQAHLTLARNVVRQPLVEAASPLRWPVVDFALVESVTDPGGARYEVVARFPG